MSKTIFEQIIDREIPASIVYEDDDVIAFLDAFPISKGHTLVVPKKPIENIFELDAETGQKLMTKIQSVATAVNAAFEPKGMNILQNNGAFASQSVFHIHFHIIPRYEDRHDGLTLGWKTDPHKYSEDEKSDIVKSIQEKL
ncbi:HIT family protein [Aliicoccus persicus]|uniref:Histidine triad (HIT) family protein n=1 Tax=Aliicoccus persicus TaxID=930138 RepID=A0A662Z6V0_9STAP|nr:HIT family protein [Aliicoccus persicus]SEW19410.1 histidine triad (HIT) family protein [Aliicoccus persicus]